jgi:hypothetical protein
LFFAILLESDRQEFEFLTALGEDEKIISTSFMSGRMEGKKLVKKEFYKKFKSS